MAFLSEKKTTDEDYFFEFKAYELIHFKFWCRKIKCYLDLNRLNLTDCRKSAFSKQRPVLCKCWGRPEYMFISLRKLPAKNLDLFKLRERWI